MVKVFHNIGSGLTSYVHHVSITKLVSSSFFNISMKG